MINKLLSAMLLLLLSPPPLLLLHTNKLLMYHSKIHYLLFAHRTKESKKTKREHEDNATLPSWDDSLDEARLQTNFRRRTEISRLIHYLKSTISNSMWIWMLMWYGVNLSAVQILLIFAQHSPQICPINKPTNLNSYIHRFGWRTRG